MPSLRIRRHLVACGAAATALAALSASAPASEPGPAAPPVEDPADGLRVTQLDNGLRILSLEDHSNPVVTFQMWVEVGSRDETRYTGLAHLFEHMMFRGSEHLGPEEHAKLISARGGRVNAFTMRDATVYFEDVTSESLPLVIDLEAERIAHLRIDQENLDTEREVVLEERRLRTDDDPDGLAFEALGAILWIAHPYRSPVIGWKSDVAQVPLEVCRHFFDTYYAPNNITIVVVGDFDSDETLPRIRRRFGSLPPAVEIPRSPTVEPPQQGERRAVVHFDVRSPVLMAGWHAPAAGNPDAEALDVASQILSEGRSSRLYRALVYAHEAALAAQGGYWELKDAGLFFAYAAARPGVPIARVEELFFAEIDRIAAEGVGAEEVEKAKRQLEVGLLQGLGTAHALAMRIGQDQLYFGRVRPLEERLEAIRAVTAEDVQRVVRTYLVPDQRSVVHVVPPGVEEGS